MVRKRIKKEDEPEEDDKGKVKKEVKSFLLHFLSTVYVVYCIC